MVRGDGTCDKHPIRNCDIIYVQLKAIHELAEISDCAMTVASLDTLSRYVSPINPAVFPHLTLVLLGIGLFFTAWFFVYEVVH